MVRTGLISPELARKMLDDSLRDPFGYLWTDETETGYSPPPAKTKHGRKIMPSGHFDHDLRFVEEKCPGCDKAIKEALR